MKTRLMITEKELRALIDYHEQCSRSYYPDSDYPDQRRLDYLKGIRGRYKDYCIITKEAK